MTLANVFESNKNTLLFNTILVLILSFISTILLLSDDFIHQMFNQNNKAEIEIRYVIVLYILSLGLWLSGSRKLTISLFALFGIFEFIQLSHISFIGEPLNASDLLNMVNSFPDVKESAISSLGDHWHVIPSVLIPYSCLLALHYFISIKSSFTVVAIGFLIVSIVILAKPYRATYRDMDQFLSGPSRSSLHNSMNSFSYFLVNLAFNNSNADTKDLPHNPYQLNSKETETKHVWVVIADSLRTDHLGVYGYSRDTTPNLLKLKDDGFLIAKEGIASGVTTAVSLSHFINLISEPGQSQLLKNKPYNLYRIAKSLGYKTFWISSQESKLMSNIGSQFIDVSISREEYPVHFMRRHDHALADFIKEQTWGEKNFVVINLRTAHLPYEANYEDHNASIALWPTHSDLERQQRMINAYDNSLRNFDDVIGQLVDTFDHLSGERYLLITSDHGQLLGENGRWGHNELQPKIIEIPMMFIGRETSSASFDSIENDTWVSHYEAGIWLAEKLGKKINNPNNLGGQHFNHGNQVLGEKYIQKISETKSGLHYFSPELLSSWLANQSRCIKQIDC